MAAPSPKSALRPWLPWLALSVLLAAILAMSTSLMVPGVVGYLNDDGLYLSSARALAAGMGYVYTFSPILEPASRFPIGYPAMLAVIVRLVPDHWAQLVVMQWHSTLHMLLFLASSFLLLTRYLGVRAPWALAIVGLVGLHPILQDLANLVMSDVPFASLSTLALVVMLVALRERRIDLRERHGLLILAGLLVAMATLVRYQGIALLAAGVLTLWLSRRFVAGIVLGAATALPLLPWVMWVLTHRATDYRNQFAMMASGQSPIEILRELLLSAHYLFVRVIPSALLPGRSPTSSPASYLSATPFLDAFVGYGLSFLVLWGIVHAVLRPRDTSERLVALYVLGTLVLVVSWNLAFTYLGYQQVVRLTLGLLPFFLYFGGRAILRFAPRLPPSARPALLALLALGMFAGAVSAYLNYPTEHAGREAFQLRGRAYSQAFAFVRTALPEDVVIGSFTGPVVHLYTGRPSVSLSFDPAVLPAEVVRHRIGYLFGNEINFAGTRAWSNYLDRAREFYPGLIEPVFFNETTGLSVWAVDQERAASIMRGK
jgi:hypothetical protein